MYFTNVYDGITVHNFCLSHASKVYVSLLKNSSLDATSPIFIV